MIGLRLEVKGSPRQVVSYIKNGKLLGLEVGSMDTRNKKRHNFLQCRDTEKIT